MSQKLAVNNFEWIEDTFQFYEVFMKSYNEESGDEYFLEVDVQYLEKLHGLHNVLPFFTLLIFFATCFFAEYAIGMRYLKQELNHGLVLKKVHRVIKFSQNAWLHPHIDMNT